MSEFQSIGLTAAAMTSLGYVELRTSTWTRMGIGSHQTPTRDQVLIRGLPSQSPSDKRIISASDGSARRSQPLLFRC